MMSNTAGKTEVNGNAKAHLFEEITRLAPDQLMLLARIAEKISETPARKSA